MSTDAGERYTHPALGFTVELPPGSEIVDDLPGIALMALEPPDRDAAFRANLVVVVEQYAGDDVEAFTDASLRTQERELSAFHLLDRAADGATTRTLGAHDSEDQAVTIEQWRLLHDGRGYTLTASCWSLDYDSLADAFATTTESFVP